jgi:hypothetical protein
LRELGALPIHAGQVVGSRQDIMGLFQSTDSSSVWLSGASSTQPLVSRQRWSYDPHHSSRICLRSRNEILVAKDHLAAGLKIGPSQRHVGADLVAQAARRVDDQLPLCRLRHHRGSARFIIALQYQLDCHRNCRVWIDRLSALERNLR